MADQKNVFPVWLKPPRHQQMALAGGGQLARDTIGDWLQIGSAAGWPEVFDVLADYAEREFLAGVRDEPGMDDANPVVCRCACLELLYNLYGSSLDKGLLTGRSEKVNGCKGVVLSGFLVDLNPT